MPADNTCSITDTGIILYLLDVYTSELTGTIKEICTITPALYIDRPPMYRQTAKKSGSSARQILAEMLLLEDGERIYHLPSSHQVL